MKIKNILLISVFLILLFGISCQNATCNCDYNEEDLAKIDSFYNVYKDFASILDEYWDNYDEQSQVTFLKF